MKNDGRMDENIIRQYRVHERELTNQFPEAISEAEELARFITNPETASADEIWPRIWDKPIYAHCRVEAAKARVGRLQPYASGAWRTWGNGLEDAFYIDPRNIRGGSDKEAFLGSANSRARAIHDTARIPLRRLFAIQGSACALRQRVEQYGEYPYRDLPERAATDLRGLVFALRGEMGLFWGHTTVLHFLTDLGLACKTDVWLMRTCRHLGLADDFKDRKVPKLQDAILINQRVRELVRALDGKVTGQRLRYVDKVLMEIGRHFLG